MPDVVLPAPGDGATVQLGPVDISATLPEGRWALLSGDDVVGVETRDPAGRFPAALEAVDARDTPDAVAGWRRVGGRLVPPAAPAAPAPSRIISGAAFLDLFTDAEVDALWDASPKLKRGAMLVMAQDSANLDSPDLVGLLGLAVTLGVLTDDRARRIAAGEPPA